MEEFNAAPGEIAGLGVLVSSLGEDSGKIADFIDQNGPPSGDFSDAIISDLVEPLRTAAETTCGRMRDIGVASTSTGIELNKAAWMYHDQEQKNYAALNAVTHDVPSAAPVEYGADIERPGQTDAYGNVATYSKPETFKLDPPSANKEDVADLVTEVAGWLGDVNETIKSITRTIGTEVNPLDMVLSPITGNWNELKRIGESYKVAGNAMEATGKNLDASVSRVGEYWDGKAAIAFEENWARRQIAAMKWEGPVGRIVNDGLTVVANEIREGIKNGARKVAIANDIASATEIKSTLDRPREGYEVGSERQPWEDG
ncbi:hypothetical protein [Aldersonia kunmingensis]|uniref:hypothetical protein n=1 Tax=Aldersonia kunmingensis TaxID=408066 RepID=UPI00082C1D33|nr:hypothetical protein [Aldersonia kunmingensis]